MTLSARRTIQILIISKSIVRICQYIGGNWTNIVDTLVGVSGHRKIVFILSIYVNGTCRAGTSTNIAGDVYNCFHYFPLFTLDDEINEQEWVEAFEYEKWYWTQISQ